jgi:hypothetical protein
MAITGYGQSNKLSEKIKVYHDCAQEWLCDRDYLRNELKMVDFVRDRFLCDVHVIFNTQFSQGGGEMNTLIFTGQNKLAGISDTLSYFNIPTAIEDSKRKKMLQFLKLGLMQFISKSPIAEKIEISYKADDSENKKQQEKDKWNFWQFRLGANGFFNGDRNYTSGNINIYLNAGRETDKNRFNIVFSNNISRSGYSIYYTTDNGNDTSEVVKVKRDAQYSEMSYVIKLSEHWGLGYNAEFSRSVFNNIDARIRVNPSVEYSIFPYKDFNNQRLIFSFDIGPSYFNYRDTTIYFKTSEWLLQQKIGMAASFTKPWGTVNFGSFYSAYLQDFSKNNVFIGGSLEWNVFKGFRIGFGGNVNLIHDQISIPKEGATRDDVLTQRRIIATSYDYFVGVGFSYTFGSIYNSQVNPTFKGLSYNFNF